VWFAIASKRGDEVVVETRRQLFNRDRETIRRRAVEYALELVLQLEPRKG
jgi:nicotinamide mononucleotide (NMN) deamidase PncC